MSKPTGGSENLPPIEQRLKSLEDRTANLQCRLEAAEQFGVFFQELVTMLQRMSTALRGTHGPS